MSQTPFQMSV